ncbi:MAG: VLRF1 family aeRF1-type release factor [Nitriliruptorales bacterium]
MTINQDLIRNLIDLHDPIGVLSVYVGITPERAAEPKPGWSIDVKNQLRELQQRTRNEAPHEHWVALSRRIEALNGDVERLLDAAEHGRGRALFAPVSEDRVERVAVQIPFRDRVIFDSHPYVRPLVAAVDEGRPAGIAVVHKRGVRVLEWQLGEARELAEEEFTIGGQDWRKKSGPAPAQPLDTRQGGQKRDQFEERVDENRLRFIREEARGVAELANSTAWDRLIVAGDPRLTKPFADELNPVGGEQLQVTDLSWEDAAPNVIAEQAWEMLKDLQRERQLALVDVARNRALSGGNGAVGVEDVLASLNEGRVDRLVFAVGARLSGYRTGGGMLYAQENSPAARGEELLSEPHLVERMIARAVQTGGTATPVDGEAAQLLADHDGVTALLRW